MCKGWTWPPPPGTKARAFPWTEERTVGRGGAAIITGWALTGEPAQIQIRNNKFGHLMAQRNKNMCIFDCVRRVRLRA